MFDEGIEDAVRQTFTRYLWVTFDPSDNEVWLTYDYDVSVRNGNVSASVSQTSAETWWLDKSSTPSVGGVTAGTFEITWSRRSYTTIDWTLKFGTTTLAQNHQEVSATSYDGSINYDNTTVVESGYSFGVGIPSFPDTTPSVYDTPYGYAGQNAILAGSISDMWLGVGTQLDDKLIIYDAAPHTQWRTYAVRYADGLVGAAKAKVNVELDSTYTVTELWVEDAIAAGGQRATFLTQITGTDPSHVPSFGTSGKFGTWHPITGQVHMDTTPVCWV
jgi:hypothetical protein